METMKEEILRLCAKHPKQHFKAIEIARRLSIKTNIEYQKLLQALHELEISKQIGIARRKLYHHLTPVHSHTINGTLSISKQGFGIIEPFEPEEEKIIIPSRFLFNAMDGDTVKVVRLASPSNHTIRGKENIIYSEGEIIEVIKRCNKPIVGTFGKSKHFYFVIPDDNRIGRNIYIAKGKTKGARPQQKVTVIIDEWKSRHLNPEGQVIEILGKAGEVQAEMASVLTQFRLPTFIPQPVLDESEKLAESIPKEEYKKRLDLRELTCFTIDPEDAKDFDDAVSLEELPKGGYRLGVHIADVSYFVNEGTQLDIEAYKRGTSVYLANSVIPMLPEKLSNHLCSLKPNEDRLTYSVFITLTSKCNITDYQIIKSVINSKRRFTYEEVQKIIETKKGDFSETIHLMYNLSQELLKKRMKEGGIDFETIETKFKFDKFGNPTEIIKKVRLDAHRLIEEFMLLANQTVAKHIGQEKREENIKPFIYRVHDQPDPEKLRNLASFVEHLGYSLNIGSGVTSKALQKLLHNVKNTEEENVINEVAIRTMAKAIYSPNNIGHFGLGYHYYTHFTSPIRRYPDLVVHRLLYEYDHKMPHKRREELQNKLPNICEQSSDREQIALEAERGSVKVMQVEYMKRHLGDEFHAIISGVTNFGLFIEISDLLVEGLVRVKDMEDDYYIYDDKNYALIGKRKKKRYRLGDKVQVQVVRVDPEEREIDFVLVKKQR